MDLAQLIATVVVAVGTIALAFAAFFGARDSRDIAQKDRAAADSRAEGDRRAIQLRSDLDHLVAIAEALESRDLLTNPGLVAKTSPDTGTERRKANGVLHARLKASPVRLPVLEAVVLDKPESANLAAVNDVFQAHGDLLPDELRKGTAEELLANPTEAARAQLYGAIRDCRTELLKHDKDPT